MKRYSTWTPGEIAVPLPAAHPSLWSIHWCLVNSGCQLDTRISITLGGGASAFLIALLGQHCSTARSLGVTESHEIEAIAG